MYETHRDHAEFLFVYIREAHPDDGWQMEDNRKDEVVFVEPTTLTRRSEVAATCSSKLKLTIPRVVDDMNNTVDELYAAWPERLFVVGIDGTIAYAGGRGPFGFKPEEVEAWLSENVAAR